MQKIISFVGSLAIGVLLTAAGLAYDLKTLTQGGILLLALWAVLWLWWWGTRSRTSGLQPFGAPDPGEKKEEEPQPSDERGKALYAIKVAMRNAGAASANRTERDAERAINELVAAGLTANKLFGIPNLTIEGVGTMRQGRDVFRRYFDCFYPLLRAGHDQEAKARALRFIKTGR